MRSARHPCRRRHHEVARSSRRPRRRRSRRAAACADRPRRAERRGQVDAARLLAGLDTRGRRHDQAQSADARRRPPAAGARPAAGRDAPRVSRAPHRRRRGRGADGRARRAPRGRASTLPTPYTEALDAFLARGGADFEARASAVLAELGLGVELDRPLDGPLRRRGRDGRRLRRSSSAASTCCCSTSRRTTSTSPGSSGSRRSSRASTARSSSSRTTARSSTGP